MKFADPHWLWALLVLPFILILLLWDEKRRQEQFTLFAKRAIWGLIAPELDPRLRVRKVLVFLAAFGFAILALARPQLGTREETVQISGLDIMVVLDVSNSMEVEDVVPSRLKKAKHVVKALVDRLASDRLGIVAFAGSSYLASPLTSDLSHIQDTLDILTPKMIQNQGTDIGLGLDTALKALERGAEETTLTPDQSTHPSRVMLLLSDGEDHEGQALQVASKLKSSGIRLYVLGVGTEKGGPIPLKDDNGNIIGYKKDGSGQVVVSPFNSHSLSQIAGEAGGKYWNVTGSEGEVGEILQDLGALDRTDYTERRYVVYEDWYQLPLAIAALLLLLELSLPARRSSSQRGQKSLALIAVGLPLLSPSAPLDAYLENQKGIRAYQDGNIEEAQRSFGSAQARDPSRPELEFNQGVIHLEGGDPDKAIEAFSQSAKKAEEQKNLGLLGKSLYNLGNSFAKKGDQKGAIQSYIGAIQSAMESKDRRLEEQARRNLELLLNEQQKKQENQQQNQSGDPKQNDENQQNQKDQDQAGKKKDQDKSKQSSKGQQKEGDEKDPSDSKGNKEDQAKDGSEKEEKSYKQNPRQRKFESKKMSPDDADRVMAELTSREKSLQEKLQTQHAKQKPPAKDW